MMKHRYVVWEGHYRGRRYREMHIIDHEDKPICRTWAPDSVEHTTIWTGRPEGPALCRNCSRNREAFEQGEKLRTWQAMAEVVKDNAKNGPTAPHSDAPTSP